MIDEGPNKNTKGEKMYIFAIVLVLGGAYMALSTGPDAKSRDMSHNKAHADANRFTGGVTIMILGLFIAFLRAFLGPI